MTSLVTTVAGTLRYRGQLGQWSWVLHRVSGLGTVLFLILHVIDTSWAAFYPEKYEQAIREYQSPLFTIGEFLLIACVVFHAFNGLRIILLDYKPAWWVHQRRAAMIVFAATLIVLAADTGARRGELCALRWRHVDIVAGTLRIEAAKNSRKRSSARAPAARSAQARPIPASRGTTSSPSRLTTPTGSGPFGITWTCSTPSRAYSSISARKASTSAR